MLIADLRRRCFPLHFALFFVGAYYWVGRWLLRREKISLCTYFPGPYTAYKFWVCARKKRDPGNQIRRKVCSVLETRFIRSST